MRIRSVVEVAAAIRGRIEGGAVGSSAATAVRGVAVDSRTVRPGDLFVALPGDRSDGHAFVGAAFDRGAGAAVVGSGREIAEPAGPLIRVPDPGRALLDLARDERSAIAATVVGITGSTGKTCTKDFTAAMLGTVMRTASSPASFNNEIGLPLTILAASPDTEAIVCEMGSRGLGHIRLLCEVARPSVGVVTNVGVAHMELFGSREAIRDAKAELPESLPPEGTAILWADDPVVRTFSDRTPADVLLFGVAAYADVRAEGVTLDPGTGRARFALVTPAGRAAAALPVAGEHMVADALAAAAVGHALGLSAEQAAQGLAGAQLSAGRMEVFETAGGFRVVDDSYNANPASMAAALKAARSMAGSGRCIAVLGGMAELGPIAGEEHERVGELVVRLGIDGLVAVGADAAGIAAAAEREGMEPERVTRCADVAAAIRAVGAMARPGDLVLVKASRVARLDRVTAALRSGASNAAHGSETTFASKASGA